MSDHLARIFRPRIEVSPALRSQAEGRANQKRIHSDAANQGVIESIIGNLLYVCGPVGLHEDHDLPAVTRAFCLIGDARLEIRGKYDTAIMRIQAGDAFQFNCHLPRILHQEEGQLFVWGSVDDHDYPDSPFRQDRFRRRILAHLDKWERALAIGGWRD